MAFTKIAEEVIEIRVEGDGDVIRAYGRIADAAESTQRTQSRAAKDAESTANSFTKLEKRLMTAGGAAQVFETGMRAAAAAMRMISAPVNLATSFEREFNLVRTLSSDVTAQTRQDLLDLAARTPQTASQIVTAAYNSLSRGIKEADLVGFLETAAGAATAGNTDITTASESLLKSLSAFKGQGESVGTVADKVFTAVKLGATNFSELNASLGQGLAVASYGVKLEELLSVAGTLTKTLGVSFGEAIVRTNGLINVVTGSTDKNRKALKALGVDYGVAAIRSKGLAAVLDDIRVKSNGSAEALTQLSGNKRAREGLLGTLSGENYKEFKAFLDGVTNSTGGFGDALGKVQGDAKSAQAQFASLKESVLRDLGEAVLPQLNRVLQNLGEYLKENRGQLVGTFKEVADAVVALGTFIVNNGDRITMLVAAMFSSKVAVSFASAVMSAGDALVSFGTTAGSSITSQIAKGMRSAPGLALISGAAMVLYDVIDDAFNMPIRKAMSELQKEIAKTLDMAAKAKGFSGGDDFERRQREAASGRRLGLGGVDDAGSFDTPKEFISRYVSTASQFVDATEARQNAIKALNEEVKRENQVRKARIAEIKKESKVDREMAQAAKEILANPQGRTLPAGYGAAAERAKEAEKQIRDLQVASLRLENLASEASAQEKRISAASAVAPSVSTTPKTSKAESDRLKRIEAMNAAFRERQAKAEIASVEDKDTRLLLEMDRRHNAEIVQARKHGADLVELFKAQDAEQAILEAQITERRAEEARRKTAESRAIDSEFTVRMAEVRGQTADAEFLRRSEEDAREIERFKAAGFNTLELEGRLAEDRLKIHQRFAAQKKIIEIQAAQSMANSIGSLVGSVKEIAKAVGASEGVIGKLESMMLLSRAAFHTAAGMGELANAATAAAGGLFMQPNPAKALAHKFAATAHFAAAGVAGLQAGRAFVGGGGSSAGSMQSGPAGSPTGPRTGRQQSQLTRQEQAPTIQFGDIHLSSIPSMLSREGASEMGKLIANDVAKELRSRSNIQGTARLPSRVIRR